MTFIPGRVPFLHLKDDNMVEIAVIDLSKVCAMYRCIVIREANRFNKCLPFLFTVFHEAASRIDG